MEIIKYSQLDEPVQVWMDEWLNGAVGGTFGGDAISMTNGVGVLPTTPTQTGHMYLSIVT